MSAWPDRPDDFVDAIAEAGLGPEDYVPRLLYGHYLRAILDEAAVAVTVGVLALGAGSDARRMLAAALAVPGGLLAVGAPTVWTLAALVPAAASAAVAVTRPAAPSQACTCRSGCPARSGKTPPG